MKSIKFLLILIIGLYSFNNSLFSQSNFELPILEAPVDGSGGGNSATYYVFSGDYNKGSVTGKYDGTFLFELKWSTIGSTKQYTSKVTPISFGDRKVNVDSILTGDNDISRLYVIYEIVAEPNSTVISRRNVTIIIDTKNKKVTFN